MYMKVSNNKHLYKKIFTITLPIAIQNLLDAAVNSADVLMLNFVGQAALSASSLATQFVGVIFMLLYGLGTGITILAAQYWGKGDAKTVEKIEGIALRYSLSISTVTAIAFLVVPNFLMSVYTPDPELIELGSIYMRIAAPGLILWSISKVYEATLRSIGRVTICTIAESIALFSNVFLNAVFIFGLFGAPKMGIAGVALATTISRLLEFVIMMTVSARSKDIKIRFGEIFKSHRVLHKDFFRMAIPATANDVIWGLAFSVYSLILGHLSSDAVAANSIVGVVRQLGTVVCYGLGTASGIIVGQIFGRGDIEEGKEASRILLRLSAYAGIFGGAIVALISPLAIRFSDITPIAADYLEFMLRVNYVYVLGTAINTTLIAGVFRAGGDSKFGFICDTITMWVYAVPLGLIAAFVLKLPVKTVYLLLCTDEFIKWPVVFIHFYRYKWAKNITRENID